MIESTRRGLLAGLGTAAVAGVAGCSVLDRDGGGDGPLRLEPTAIETILEPTAPEVRRPAPHQPGAEAIEAGIARYEELIDAVPESISPEEVPNGVVREEIEDARIDAVDARAAVEAEPDRLRRLDGLRTARKSAREAAVGFEAVRNDLTAEIRLERRETRTDVGVHLAQVAYAGEDRGRTLLFAFRLEELLTDARRQLTHGHGFRPSDPNALEVAEAAGDVEYAAATKEMAEALTARHTATVDDPVDFAEPAAAALQSSMVALGRADLPDSRTSIEEVFGEEPERRDLQYLASNATSAVRRWQEHLSTELSEGRFATGLEGAIRFQRDAAALDTVRRRIRGDDIPTPESAAPIRAEREAALKAAEAVPASPSEPSLASDVVAQLHRELARLDGEIEQRYIERDADATLTREYARYVLLRARFEALPDAIEAVRDRFDSHLS